MSNKAVQSLRIRVRHARLSYAQLYEPKPYKNGDKPRFAATWLLDPASSELKVALAEPGQSLAEMSWKTGAAAVRAVQTEALRVVKEQYGEAAANEMLAAWKAGKPQTTISQDKICLGFGDHMTKKPEGYEGIFYVKTYMYEAQGRPLVVDKNNSPVSKQSDKGAPYSGCYVDGTFSLYCQPISKGYGMGIAGSMHAVKFAGDGPAFSGSAGVDVEEEFEAQAGAAAGSSTDWDDDVPF